MTAGSNEAPDGAGDGEEGAEGSGSAARAGLEEADELGEEKDEPDVERTWVTGAAAVLVENVVISECVDTVDSEIVVLVDDAWGSMTPSGPIAAAPSMIIDTATANHRSLRDSVMGDFGYVF